MQRFRVIMDSFDKIEYFEGGSFSGGGSARGRVRGPVVFDFACNCGGVFREHADASAARGIGLISPI